MENIRNIEVTVLETHLNPPFPKELEPKLSMLSTPLKEEYWKIFSQNICPFPHCMTKFNFRSHFKRHMHARHTNTINECYACKKIFSHIIDYTDHLKDKHMILSAKNKKNTIICSTCHAFCMPEKYNNHCNIAINKKNRDKKYSELKRKEKKPTI